MVFTFDSTTDRGRVRLLATDIDSANALFQDAEIDAFLALEGGSVKLAAAQALDTLGSNSVLILKVIRNLDLQTDGAAVGRELRTRAASLRNQVEDDVTGDWDGVFDVAELVPDSFSARERLRNEVLRGA